MNKLVNLGAQLEIHRTKNEMDLLQLHYYDDVWKMMVACIMLNRTKRAQVDRIRHAFFECYPHPSWVNYSNISYMEKMIKSLGFSKRRSKMITDFSNDYLKRDRNLKGYDLLLRLGEMRGIGDYALDSYAIFILGHINIGPKDKELSKYVKYLGACMKNKKKKYVLLAGQVTSERDGDRHWISAKQLLRLYNFHPSECYLIESDRAWNAFLKTRELRGLKVFGPQFRGANYTKVHDREKRLANA